MGNLLGRWARLVARVVAIGWLLAIAPIEVATALAGLIRAGATPLGAIGLVLVASRALVVAAGLVLGRQLLQQQPGTRSLAWGWAVADLATLAIVLARTPQSTSRAPGDAPLVWLTYALAAVVVLGTATPASTPRRDARDATD